LGEVREYYAREDVLEFLNYACQKRKVIFSFKDELSLRSESSNLPLGPRNVEDLRRIIAQRMDENMPGMSDDARPQAYPSFHGMTAKDGDVIGDFVMEADLHGWRRSFVDVRGAIEFLNDFRVPYIAKFSGHRSLHVMIPREVFPEEFGGKPMEQAWPFVQRKLRDFFRASAGVRHAHDTGGILRLPYSLNENTGMVSLPIPYERMDDFRPWEAITHLVEGISPDVFDVSPGDRDRTHQFLCSVVEEEWATPLEGKMWRIQRKQDLDRYRHLMGDPLSIQAGFDSDDPAERAEAAWRLMISGARVPDEILKGYSQECSPDVRWFIAEALTGDDRVAELLHETDEYAADAIANSVSLSAAPFLKRLLSGGIDWESSPEVSRNIRAISERSTGVLKDEALKQAEDVPEDRVLTLLKCASVLGGDYEWDTWDTVCEVAATLERRFPWKSDVISSDVFENIRILALNPLDHRHLIHAAEEALVEAGSRATEPLILAMGSTDHLMRKSVLGILCRVRDPKALPTLISSLGDPSGKLRRMAMNAILKFRGQSEDLRELLIEAAESDNPRLRSNATKALGLVDTTTALEVAQRSLEDRDSRVRLAAVESLARTHSPSAVEPQKRALADEDMSVVLESAFALSDIGNEGVEVLKMALRGSNTKVAMCAAHALVGVGDNSGIPLVIEALNHREYDISFTPFSLAESGDERAKDALLGFVEDSLHDENMSPKALRAIQALGNYSDERAIDILRTVMHTRRDRKPRRSAVMGLQKMGTEEAVDSLLKALVSQDGNLRQHVRNVVVKMGPEILPKLKSLLEQAEGKSRRAVESVIESLEANVE